MTSESNKWASRAVVILQLAAWSAVGIVLLHKGVSSLQKGPELKNITQVIPIETNVHHSSDEKNLSVIPIEKDKLMLDENKTEEDETEDDDVEEPKVLESVDSLLIKKLVNKTKLNDKESGENKWLKIEEAFVNSGNNKHQTVFINSNSTKDESWMLKSSQRLLEKKTDTNFNISDDESIKLISKNNENNETLIIVNKTILNSVRSGIWESKRRLRLSHLSGGGAAAAVAMVAVGAVMLVLGPAVIVLRALDERRQERRFLKLSAGDDLPPTYEQATLMDEAPRYSTLNLSEQNIE